MLLLIIGCHISLCLKPELPYLRHERSFVTEYVQEQTVR